MRAVGFKQAADGTNSYELTEVDADVLKKA